MIVQRHEADDLEPPPRYTSQDELGLLGSMLFEPEQIPEVLRTVGSRDFGDTALRAAFSAIRDHYVEAKGNSTKLAIAVRHTLRDSPFVDNDQILIGEIMASVSTGVHAPSYARAVRDAALKRRILDITSEAARAATNGRAGSEVLADLLADIDALQRSGDRNGGIEQFTAGELFEKYPEEKPFVIDGLCRRGEVVNIVAAAKKGKSWFLDSLALSIVANRLWLDRFEVAPGPFLLIDNELTRQTLSRRLRTVAEYLGIPLSFIEKDLIVWPLRGNLKSLEDLGPLLDRFEPGYLQGVGIDAFYRTYEKGASENDNAQMAQRYNLADQYAAKLDATLFFVHHSSRGNQAEKSVTDTGAGAGAQSRAADTHLVLRDHEQEGCAVLDCALRSFAPMEPVVLRWEWPLWRVADHLDPSKLAGRLGKGQQARTAEDAADKSEIISKLENAAEPLSMKGIREATGYGKEKAERLICSLIADGQILKGEGVVGRQKCNVYMLADSAGTAGTQEVQTPSVPLGEGDPEGGWGGAYIDRRTPSPPSAGTPAAESELIGEESFHQFANGGAA